MFCRVESTAISFQEAVGQLIKNNTMMTLGPWQLCDYESAKVASDLLPSPAGAWLHSRGSFLKVAYVSLRYFYPRVPRVGEGRS